MNKIKTSASDTLMNLKINNLPFFTEENLCVSTYSFDTGAN